MDFSTDSGYRSDVRFRREFQKKRSRLAEEKVNFERLYRKYLALYEEEKKSHAADKSYYQRIIDNLTEELNSKNDTLEMISSQIEDLHGETVEMVKEVAAVKQECRDDCNRHNEIWVKTFLDNNEKQANQLKERDEKIRLLEIEVSLLTATLNEVSNGDIFDIESLTEDEGSESANESDE